MKNSTNQTNNKNDEIKDHIHELVEMLPRTDLELIYSFLLRIVFPSEQGR